jgi:hypothetical protein
MIHYKDFHKIENSSGIMHRCSTPNFVQISQKICKVKKEGKAVQLQAWTGPEGSRRLRLPDFYTIGTGR